MTTGDPDCEGAIPRVWLLPQCPHRPEAPLGEKARRMMRRMFALVAMAGAGLAFALASCEAVDDGVDTPESIASEGSQQDDAPSPPPPPFCSNCTASKTYKSGVWSGAKLYLLFEQFYCTNATATVKYGTATYSVTPTCPTPNSGRVVYLNGAYSGITITLKQTVAGTTTTYTRSLPL